MKHVILWGILAGAGYFGWHIGGSLNTDAMGMAVGIILGAVAAIPAALLLLAHSRRQDESSRRRHAGRRQSPYHHPAAYAGYTPPQPPVIVLAGAGMTANGGQFASGATGMGAWEESRPARRFKVVGEQEAWIDEW